MPNNVLDSGLQESRKLTKPLCSGNRKRKKKKTHRISGNAAAKSLQSCPNLCDLMDGSPPGSSVHGIFQARVLEWGAIAFSDFR